MKELELKGLNEKIYVHETKCGLPIYMWVNEKVTSTYMTLSVKYGSIHTKFKIGKKTYNVPNGIAHFLEHIKFNIDESTTAHDEFYKISGDANAFTTFNYTSYLVFATEHKKENLNLLLDFVFNPYFTKKMINKEKGIIIEEANMGEDDPYMRCFYHSLEHIFEKSKYRNLITGTKEDVSKINLEDIELVYNTFYHPKNMFLCITGNFNPYEMVQVVEDNLAKKEFQEYVSAEIIEEKEPKQVSNKYTEEELNITYPRLNFHIKLPIDKIKEKNQSLLELKVLTNLLLNINFGATSDFKDELLECELITGMYYTTDFYGDYFVIGISATTNYKDEVIKRIKEKFQNLDINENDIKRKRNAAVATLILDYEDVESVNMKLQDEILNYGGIQTNYKEMLESQTKEDLEKLISKINLDNVAISIYLPKEESDNN